MITKLDLDDMQLRSGLKWATMTCVASGTLDTRRKQNEYT